MTDEQRRWIARLRRALQNVPDGVAIAFSQDHRTWVRVLDVDAADRLDPVDGWHAWHHDYGNDCDEVVLAYFPIKAPSDVGAP